MKRVDHVSHPSNLSCSCLRAEHGENNLQRLPAIASAFIISLLVLLQPVSSLLPLPKRIAFGKSRVSGKDETG
eukprot:638792-Pleurochrysis_carterae.AAC.1